MVAPMSLKDAYYVLGRQYGEEDARRLIRYLMDLVVVAPFGQKECVRSLLTRTSPTSRTDSFEHTLSSMTLTSSSRVMLRRSRSPRCVPSAVLSTLR